MHLRPVKKNENRLYCEKFFATLVPSFLRPTFLKGENTHTVCPVPQSAPHVSVRMNVLDYSEGPRRKATDVCPWDGVCSRGGLLRRKGEIQNKRSHRENAGYSERVITPLRAQKTQRKIRLKNFGIFVFFVVHKYYVKLLNLRVKQGR